MNVRFASWAAVLALGLACQGAARAQAPAPATETAEAPSPCGPVAIPAHYGPYDYVLQPERLVIVHQFHFNSRVENLIAGQSGSIGGDLSYVLNASPNHHRALLAAMNYAAKTKSATPPDFRMSVECYFDRAIRFRANDTVVRALFAIYLSRLGRLPEAKKQLEAATFYAGDNGISHHNIGLTYFDLGLYDEALREAHLARKHGFPGPLLQSKLQSVNKWKEPSE